MSDQTPHVRRCGHTSSMGEALVTTTEPSPSTHVLRMYLRLQHTLAAWEKL